MSRARILIIDDEELFREDLAMLLGESGYDCRTAPSADEGLKLAIETMPDVILCDIAMPGKSGIEILDELVVGCPNTHIVMVTAFGALETAIQTFRKGAVDYILKPLVIEDVLQKLDRLIRDRDLGREIRCLRRLVSADDVAPPIIGRSKPMEKIFSMVDAVAPTSTTVLISGESGTGKELVARAVHARSSRREHPFVAINCAGFPENLLESELFGHVRGAFTGAHQSREGFLELAADGTVLLDEVGEIPITLQSKLLRVLEQREFHRVGSSATLPLQARVVAASNRDLAEMIKQGEFREDLYYRLAVFEIKIPSLRERTQDIPLLIDHFIQLFNREMGKKCLGVDNTAAQILLAYSWPGNVRQLRNVLERAMILLDGGDFITADLLPESLAGRSPMESSPQTDNLKESMRVFELAHIRRVLASCDGNKEEASRRLGINPSTLHRKLADAAENH